MANVAKLTTSAIGLALGAALFLGACATPRSSALDQARSDVAAVKADPNVLRYAQIEVAAAQQAIDAGDAALADGAPESDVDTHAYVASQRAAAAREIAASRADQEQIAKSGETRERALRQSLEQQLAELQAQRTERGTVVSLAGDVLFPVDGTTLSPGGVRAIDRVATVLRDNPGTTAMVEGHTDDTGAPSYNLQLSERRAESVRAELVAAGVEAPRVIARGLGEDFPKAPNSTSIGRQENRRVEIILQEPAGATAGTRPAVVSGG